MKTLIFGRSGKCDITITGDTKISRQHIQIVELNDGRYLVLDLNSANGTYINGHRLPKGTDKIIEATDIIRIGNKVIPWRRYFIEDHADKEQIVDSRNESNTGEQTSVAIYANFWLRLGAVMIDSILIGIVLLLVAIIITNSGEFSDSEAQTLSVLSAIILQFLYFTLMESSAKQGSPGKMALRIKVVNANLQRLTFAEAFNRNMAKFVTVLIFGIGFIMVGFTPKKQALHDKIANTLVIIAP